jgi:ethanolamine kinase
MPDIDVIQHSILPRLQSDLDLALCHHDLQSSNILYDSASKSVSFIDFEYSQVNYALYDVADHFGAYAGIHDPDYSIYPTREEQLRFLRIYFDARGIKNFEEEKTLRILKQIAVLPHLWWFLWALVQANISSVDFNYSEYARIQLEMYLKLKSNLFDAKY